MTPITDQPFPDDVVVDHDLVGVQARHRATYIADAVGLPPEAVLAFAELVMDLAAGRSASSPGRRLLTVAEVAQLAGRSRDWVRDHRAELGVVTVGHGPRPRLMFDGDAVRRRLSAPAPEPYRIGGGQAAAPRRRRRPSTTVELLPIKGRQA
jgi:hypothetical protein